MDDRLMYRHYFYIGDEWITPIGDERLRVISPSTEDVVGEVPFATSGDVDRAVDAARRAFEEGPWPRMTPHERAEGLRRVAILIRQQNGDIADVLVEESGSATTPTHAGQVAVASVFEYYADLIEEYEFDRCVETGGGSGMVSSLPVGVVGAILPFNSPVTLAIWKAAPALAAGCSIVIKPPPETPLSCYLVADAFHQAGLPDGVVNIVPGDRAAGEHLVTHPLVDKITFTGSTDAGKRIMSLCGNQVKRVSLELGGKSAAILLDDVDMNAVMTGVVTRGMARAGQVCAAQTRLLVPRRMYEDAVEVAVAAANSVPCGDPRDPSTIVGPLVAERQRERVEKYIELAVAEGARVVAGGKRPSGQQRGWYVEPTILADVENTMRVAREEIFGPVLSLIAYEDVTDAIHIANDSPYGLSGGVWSDDASRAFEVARQLRTGSVNVNSHYPPYPAVPFGGFRESGVGRELGPQGLTSFLEMRSIGIPATLVEDRH